MKKKTVFSFIMVFALIFSILPTINANADTTWNLAWSDEFNGSITNKANWISGMEPVLVDGEFILINRIK